MTAASTPGPGTMEARGEGEFDRTRHVELSGPAGVGEDGAGPGGDPGRRTQRSASSGPAKRWTSRVAL